MIGLKSFTRNEKNDGRLEIEVESYISNRNLGHCNWVISLLYIKEKNLFITTGNDKFLKIFSYETCKCVKTIVCGNGGPWFHCIQWDHDTFLTSGGENGKLLMYSLISPFILKKTIPTRVFVYRLLKLNDNLLVYVTRDGNMNCYSIEEECVVKKFSNMTRIWRTKLVLSKKSFNSKKGSQSFYSNCGGSCSQIWSFGVEHETKIIDSSTELFAVDCYLEKGSENEIVIAIGWDCKLQFYDTSKKCSIGIINLPEWSYHTDILDDRYLAVAIKNGILIIMDLYSPFFSFGEKGLIEESDIVKFGVIGKIHENWINSIAFTRKHGKFMKIISVSSDSRIGITRINGMEFSDDIDEDTNERIKNLMDLENFENVFGMNKIEKINIVIGETEIENVFKIFFC